MHLIRTSETSLYLGERSLRGKIIDEVYRSTKPIHFADVVRSIRRTNIEYQYVKESVFVSHTTQLLLDGVIGYTFL